MSPVFTSDSASAIPMCTAYVHVRLASLPAALADAAVCARSLVVGEITGQLICATKNLPLPRPRFRLPRRQTPQRSGALRWRIQIAPTVRASLWTTRRATAGRTQYAMCLTAGCGLRQAPQYQSMDDEYHRWKRSICGPSGTLLFWYRWREDICVL
jgi:hypothetical protein